MSTPYLLRIATARGDEGWGACIDDPHVAGDRHGCRVGRDLMRAAAEWACATQSGGGVYLWVMDANAAARTFSDRLGALYAGTVAIADPGGGHAANCRYVRADAGALL